MNDERERPDVAESMRRGIYILPNLFTTGSLFAGFIPSSLSISA